MKKILQVLIASQEEAKLFEYGHDKQFKLIDMFDNELFKNEDLFTSPPGRSNPRMAHGQFALNNEDSQKVDLRHHFVHSICDSLHKKWERHPFDFLALIAEPKTIGDLRKYLHKTLKDIITYEGSSNLMSLPDAQIIEHLQKIGLGAMIKP